MQALNPGYLPLPITVMLVMVALFVAAWAGRLAGRSQQTSIGSILIYMLIAAVPAARIAFVSAHFDAYRSAPWSMLDISDGGFMPWAGLAAALLVAAWRGWRRASLRKPLVAGLAAGALAWGGMLGAISKLNNATLPTVSLTTLAGEQVDLAGLAAGKPMVVNLWASWCPPCRREMPVLAAAQKQEKDVLFVFADQGEDGTTAQNYLAGARLDLANVLLNPGADFGREVGSTALPTTLFYDANGRLVDTNLGELSPELLAGKLDRLRMQSNKE
jgi:thiol-disulfide isomerase/thioredoxin